MCVCVCVCVVVVVVVVVVLGDRTDRSCEMVTYRLRASRRRGGPGSQRGAVRSAGRSVQLAAATVPLAEQAVARTARDAHARHPAGDRALPALVPLLVLRLTLA